MTLVRWRPASNLVGVRDEMDRLFHDFFGTQLQGTSMNSTWQPRMDLTESEDEIVVTAELPGVSKDEAKISLQDDVLIIQGEKKQNGEEKRENFHRVERSYGTFQRAIQLPAAVDAKKIKARFKDGVLTVVLPKAEESKLKEIPISFG